MNFAYHHVEKKLNLLLEFFFFSILGPLLKMVGFLTAGQPQSLNSYHINFSLLLHSVSIW